MVAHDNSPRRGSGAGALGLSGGSGVVVSPGRRPSVPGRSPRRGSVKDAQAAQAAAAAVTKSPVQGASSVAARESLVTKEVDEGVLSFEVTACCDENTPQVQLERLVALKVLFSTQLPNMPREYIVRLLFDPRHKSLTLLKGGQVIGGITYRTFGPQGFAEIVFCAVSADEQVRGYGSRLMQRMKMHALKEEKVSNFLTYADNNAIGYFSKQGFSKEVTMPRDIWTGFIKDYDGGTLMECAFSEAEERWRADFPQIIRKQREAVDAVVRSLSNKHKVYGGLQAFQSLKERSERGLPPPPGELRPRVAVQDIPGVVAAGWSPQNDCVPTLCFAAVVEQASAERREYAQRAAACKDGEAAPKSAWPLRSASFEAGQQAQLQALHRALKDHADAWPFHEPVDVREVPDYANVIRDPIDLSEIGRRVVVGDYYSTIYMFVADVQRMLRNCKLYNSPSTIYYKCATRMETYFAQQLLARTIELD